MRSLVILGSTGSIGQQALDLVRRYPGRLRVVGLGAGRRADLLLEQVHRFRPRVVALADPVAARRLETELPAGPVVLAGEEGMRELAGWPEADTVVVATSGLGGLVPTLAALQAGKRVALANKETLVAAGNLVMAAARGKELLPVDSEHVALHQCLRGEDPAAVRRIILTGSGGPFRTLDAPGLARVTAREALRHPVWKMGPKITVDSATLMNKGLEVIEAHHLFGVDYDRIEVLIHPEGVVHSLVEMGDGSVLAQLGPPDMRLALAYALFYPERVSPPVSLLELAGRTLTFEPPRLEDFPCLRHACRAGRMGGTMPAVLSAADEVAVERFLRGEISFPGISRVVGRVMEEHVPGPAASLEEILEADAWARRRAAEVAGE
ncbi:MAG: 1-deoxy-D-xylulose-5-phosphate reductoisomerase [Firmicutes bacterium]|nr:1-deoxy-D-xylulose-5-phosphate reductoisomerase [Bacillota bacterium]